MAERCRRRGDGAAAIAALKAAFSESDPAPVRAGYRRACELLRARDGAGADLLEEAEPAALAYLDLPREHRLWIRTNNVQERMNREIRRRTSVVQVFPSTASLLRLVGAVCCDQNDAWACERNFIDRRSMEGPLSAAPSPEPSPAEVGSVLGGRGGVRQEAARGVAWGGPAPGDGVTPLFGTRYSKVNNQMKLRNFLYLNTKVVEDYIAAIDGYTCDEESQAISTSKENAVSGKGTIGVASGNGSHVGKQSEEIKRSVHISDAAKFEKVYKYLRSDDEGLKYFEFLTDADYSGLYRDDFLEVLVTARFSKMKELTDSVKKIAELATVLESFTDQQILDKKPTKPSMDFRH